MATEKQKRELVDLARRYTNAQSNGNSSAVKALAKEIKNLKEKSK